MVEAKSFLLNRHNCAFLEGITEPAVKPDLASLLLLPAGVLKLLKNGHPIRATITFASGILQFVLLGVFVIGILCFLLYLSFFMAGMFLVLVESCRRAAGFGPSTEGFYIPLLVVAWAVALVLNMTWATAGFRRSLPRIAAGLHLARIGKVLQGQVVSCETSSRLYHNGWNEEVLASFVMSYSFVTPAGKKLSAYVNELPFHPTKGWNPEPGDPIAVLYADDGNFQAL